jgi:hypothetical protein
MGEGARTKRADPQGQWTAQSRITSSRHTAIIAYFYSITSVAMLEYYHSRCEIVVILALIVAAVKPNARRQPSRVAIRPAPSA